MWTGDNLPVLRGLNSASVDLIYLDPPFNSNKTYSAPIGSKAAGAAFKDTWTLDDVDLAWHGEIAEQSPAVYAVIDAAGVAHGKGMKSYLIMMAVRLLEMHRVLKPTGSLYLHCDPTASHYLKLLLDAVFQPTLFVNEIAWCYNVGGKSKRHWARKHDTLLFYAKSKNWHFNGSAVGVSRDTGTKSFGGKIGTDDQGRKYQDKRVKATGKYYRYYLDSPKIPEDWWVGINSIQSQATERVGYPTQKPLGLLDRIIKASSNQSDVVLDPFAGCATACVSAESLGRQWIGVDLSPWPHHSSRRGSRRRSSSSTRSTIEPTSRAGRISERSRTTERTSINCSGNRRAAVRAVTWRFPFGTSRWITRSHRARVDQTTSTTCNCSAGPATA